MRFSALLLAESLTYSSSSELLHVGRDSCGLKRGGDRVALLAYSTVGKCYPLLVRLQPVAGLSLIWRGIA